MYMANFASMHQRLSLLLAVVSCHYLRGPMGKAMWQGTVGGTEGLRAAPG